MICTRSHKGVCAGSLHWSWRPSQRRVARRESRWPIWSGAACMSTEAFLGLSVQAQPFLLSASQRSGVLRQAEATCFLQGEQPRLWLLGNSSAWAQLASLLTGGRGGVSVGGRQRCSGLITFWRVRACVHVCMCVYVHVIRDRLRRGLKHSCQQPLLSLHPGKRGTIGRPVSCATPGLQAKKPAYPHPVLQGRGGKTPGRVWWTVSPLQAFSRQDTDS